MRPEIYLDNAATSFPKAHRLIGTYPQGCVRFSIGACTVVSQIQRAIAALKAISARL